MEKYHKTDIAPVEQENERDETYRASNPQIDCSRTNGNYHIIKRQRSYTQFINDKIEALYLPTKVRRGFGQRIFQKFISTGTGKILCGLYSFFCRQIQRRQYYLGGRTHGRNYAASASELNPDC